MDPTRPGQDTPHHCCEPLLTGCVAGQWQGTMTRKQQGGGNEDGGWGGDEETEKGPRDVNNVSWVISKLFFSFIVHFHFY